jgi:probable HAF family extracellular repeat protein
MTLNITLVTRWGIHQSADFRLVDADTAQLVSDSSAKLLQLAYETWHANVTYCGIGRWRQFDTYQWLERWLTHPFGEHRTFSEILDIIARDGSGWIGQIARETGKLYAHTFVVTAFVSARPFVALVSNIQRLDSAVATPPSPDLRITLASVHRRRLVITGIERSVSPEDRHLVKSLGHPPVNTYAIQRTIAQVNERAAFSAEAKDAISPSCWVNSSLADGSAQGRYYGEVEGELTPVMLLQGMNLLSQIHLSPAPGRKIQMTGSTFVTSRSLASKNPVECSPHITKPDQPSALAIRVIDVGHFGGSTARVNGVNNLGHLAGESFVTPSGPVHAFLWKDGVLLDIGTLGANFAMAKDINDNQEIVGTSQLHTGDNRAFLWSSDQGMIELGTLGGRHSNAVAINNPGEVVGSSWTVPGDNPRDPKEHAYVWDKARGIRDLVSRAGSWSRALDINDHSEIIGISPSDGFTRGFLWTPARGMVDIGSLGGPSCQPAAINNRSQVVGMSETTDGRLRPFIWSPSEGIVEVPIEGDVLVRDINDDGYIVGDAELSVGKRSFVWCSQAGIHFLPCFDRHYSEALAISKGPLACGQIIGHETHCHGILWLPERAEAA